MTLGELRRNYSLFKKKYYAGLNLPPVSRVRFRWAGQHPMLKLHTELACVWPDGQKWIMEFHPVLKDPWLYRLCLLILLHEMSHISNPKADHGPWFHQEATRLGSLGAMRDFWV